MSSDDDRLQFPNTLRYMNKRSSGTCQASCLMDNDDHLHIGSRRA